MAKRRLFRHRREPEKFGHSRPCRIAQQHAGHIAFFAQSATKRDDPVHAFADEQQAGPLLFFDGLYDACGDGLRLCAKELFPRAAAGVQQLQQTLRRRLHRTPVVCLPRMVAHPAEHLVLRLHCIAAAAVDHHHTRRAAVAIAVLKMARDAQPNR